MTNHSKKYKKAIAIKYDQECASAPEVVAKGAGEMANQIVTIGGDHEVPIVNDSKLVELLYPLEPGEMIPPSLYKPVATLLAFFVYYKQRKLSDTHEKQTGINEAQKLGEQYVTK